MKNIYLIGFMGCGKSTVSQILERTYGFKRLEMDEEIVRKEGRSIKDIFETNGEAYFREAETSLLKSFQSSENLVVSCGGGTAMREENIREMKKNGRIVLLSAHPETVYNRIKDSHDRPLLEGNMNVEYIESLMAKRRANYVSAADFTVMTDDKTAEEISKEIIALLQG